MEDDYTLFTDKFLICRTAVYEARLYGGVGGGSREASPYPIMDIMIKRLLAAAGILVSMPATAYTYQDEKVAFELPGQWHLESEPSAWVALSLYRPTEEDVSPHSLKIQFEKSNYELL